MTDIIDVGLSVDTRQVKNASKDLDTLTKSADKTTKSVDKFGNELTQASKDMGRFIDKSGKMREANGRLVKGLDKTNTSLKTTTASTNILTKAINAAAVAAAGAFVINGVVKFEDAMLGLQATSSATANEMAKLEKQARTLGATSVFSASQVGESQKFLAQAGFNTSEILNSTSATLKLASAGALELATAADIASNVMGGMNLEVADLGGVVDALAQAARSSNTNITQLGSALSTAAPLASAAGVSLEEVSAAIGVLSDNALQGERAGTGFGGVIRQLSNVTPKAAAALANYGIKAADVNIQTKGLSSVLNTLGKVTISAGDAITIFGSEAAAAGLILGKNSVKFDELTGKIRDSEGAAIDMADTLSSGLSGSFKSFGSAVDEAALQLGKGGLGEALQGVVDGTTALISAFTGMLPVMAESNNLSADYVKNVTFLADAIKAVGIGLGIAATAYVSVQVAIAAATAAAVAFNFVIAANPIGLLISAVGLAVIGVAAYVGITEDATKASGDLNETLEESARIYAMNGQIIGDVNEKQLNLAIDTANAAITSAQQQVEASKTIITSYANEIEAAQAMLAVRSALAEGAVFYSAEDAAAIVDLENNINELTGAISFQTKSLVLSSQAIDDSEKNIATLTARLEGLKKGLSGTSTGTGKLSDAQKKLNKLMKDGESVFKSTRTPLEKHRIELKKINELLAIGAINQDTYSRAVRALTEDFKDATGVTAENEAALKAIEDQQQKTFDSWSDNLTGIISGTLSLGDVLDDLARKLLQKAFVDPLLISVGLGPAGSVGGAGGIAQAGGAISSGFDLLSGDGLLSGSPVSGFSGFARSGIGQSLGLSTLSPTFTGAKMGIGATTSLTGAGEFLGGGFSASAGIGGMAANLMGLGSGNALADTATSVIGGAIGNALLPGIGGAIGSFLGTALGGMFGGSNRPPHFSFRSVPEGSSWNEGTEGVNRQTIDGAFGRTAFSITQATDEEARERMKAIGPVISSITSLEAIIASTFSAEQIARVTEDVTSPVRTGLLDSELMGGWYESANADETINDFISSRLGFILEEVDPIIDSLLESADLAGVESLQYAAALVSINDELGKGGALFGLFNEDLESTAAFLEQIKGEDQSIGQAYEALSQAQEIYSQNFSGENEKSNKILLKASESLSEFNDSIGLTGAAALDTKEEFKAYIEALNLTTDAGRKALESALAMQAALLIVSATADAFLDERQSLLLAEKNTAISSAEAAFDSIKSAVSLEKSAAKTKISELNGVISSANSALRTLRGANTTALSIDRAAARGVVSNAAGGGDVSSAALKNALSVVSKPSEGLFETFEDYQRDFFKTSIDISALSESAEGQLSVEEQSLESLDALQDSAQAQIDALHGIDGSVMSLGEAMAALAAGIAAATLASSAISNSSAAVSGIGTGADNGAQAIEALYTFGLGRAPDQGGLNYWKDQLASGVSFGEVKKAFFNSAAINEEPTINAFANGGTHSGGVRLVGERGPELELTGPSRIMSNSDLKSSLNGGGQNNVEHENKMNVILSKMALIQDRFYRLAQKWDVDALNVRVVA